MQMGSSVEHGGIGTENRMITLDLWALSGFSFGWYSIRNKCRKVYDPAKFEKIQCLCGFAPLSI